MITRFGAPVLVRDSEEHEWKLSYFHSQTTGEFPYRVFANSMPPTETGIVSYKFIQPFHIYFEELPMVNERPSTCIAEVIFHDGELIQIGDMVHLCTSVITTSGEPRIDCVYRVISINSDKFTIQNTNPESLHTEPLDIYLGSVVKIKKLNLSHIK